GSRAKLASPESITTIITMKRRGANISMPGNMDSGLATARRPGMTWRWSLALHSRLTDDFRPLGFFLGDVGRVGIGTERQRLGAFDRQPALHLVARQRSVERGVQLLDYRPGRAGGGDNPVMQHR